MATWISRSIFTEPIFVLSFHNDLYVDVALTFRFLLQQNIYTNSASPRLKTWNTEGLST
jgi:hypothetical protein